MFEWFDRVNIYRRADAFIPLEAFWRGDLVAGNGVHLPRRDWRSMVGRGHYITIGVGTLVVVRPALQTVSFMVREPPTTVWEGVPFKFKPDSRSAQTLDEKLVYAIRKSGWQAPAQALTTGGIPWELALIADLEAQAAAVRAWREETSYLSAM